jgi:hypothetical protein
LIEAVGWQEAVLQILQTYTAKENNSKQQENNSVDEK